IVLEGEITAQLEDGKGGVVRLRKMGPGAIIGEMGLYMNTPASASVIANSEARVLFISKAVFEEMEESYPATAAAVHRWVIRILGERLAAGNRTLQALLR
ncbi:MAG: cyclic nucleotide-binding domain-containing protein, partial [Calditrichaeota bacterium]|nr:cyclic nucleotide-binding domain-containing protein [Calditrichota bacterium]